MDFSFIGNFADLLAAFGVIASLIFLAVQVRRNTAEVKNSHLQSSHALMASFQSRTQNELSAAIIEKGKHSYHDLGDAEKLVFSSWIHEWLLVADNFMRLGQDGILAPGLAEFAEERMRWLFTHPGVGEFWRSAGREPYPDAPSVRLGESVLKSQTTN